MLLPPSSASTEALQPYQTPGTSPHPQMSSPPPLEVPSIKDAYDQLISILHPPEPTVLEIDFLPSSYPSQILYEHPALALPKSLLVKLFLRAREIFFNEQLGLSQLGDDGYDARLKATSVILLFDPNHITAANFRKRHILNCRDRAAKDSHQDDKTSWQSHVIQRELCFLTTLLTSPLKKHTKASTLWAQRLWIFRNFIDILVNTPDETAAVVDGMPALWKQELEIVIKAGERHPRNYYGWDYARKLFNLLKPAADKDHGIEDADVFQKLLIGSSKTLYAWCLMHPRDVSGWSFMIFWLQNMKNQTKASNLTLTDSNPKQLDCEINRIVKETRTWTARYDWDGESVCWFLKAVMQTGLDYY